MLQCTLAQQYWHAYRLMFYMHSSIAWSAITCTYVSRLGISAAAAAAAGAAAAAALLSPLVPPLPCVDDITNTNSDICDVTNITVLEREAYQPHIVELPVQHAHGVGSRALQPPPQPNGCLICNGLLELCHISPPSEHPGTHMQTQVYIC